MKIMVAFLGNKKNEVGKTSSIRNLNTKINNFSRDNTLNRLNNFNNLSTLKNKKSVNNSRNVSSININNNKNTSKVINNRVRGNIYATVVRNENISKNSKTKIDKLKAISNIDEILNIKQNSNIKNSNVKFKNIPKDNIFEKSELKISRILSFILVTVPLFIMLFSNSKIANNLLINFSTNFRQANNYSFEVADLIKAYGLYNTNNYIINEEIEQIVEKAEEVVVTSDEELIDKEAEISDVQAFFGNDNINVEITENSNSIQRVTIGGTKILNYSSKRDIDYEGLINSDVILTKKSDKILLYNTHTSESYTNSEGYKFEYTGTMRTTDASYNMLAIAKKFNENLKLKGFDSVQDTTPHDYGTYTSAYAKSRITVKSALESMSGAGIIIDVHRDASSNLAYRPVANIKGVQVAQLMFVVGVGSSSSPNDNWQENLKLALKLQQLADKVYPGLFRPMIIRNSVYNQDLNKYALLIEFGATGNTIEEVKLSTRCMTNLLNIMYKD